MPRPFLQRHQTDKDARNVHSLIAHEFLLKENEPIFSILEKEDHFLFLQRHLVSIGKFSQGLDTGQPWIMFWCLNGMHLLQDGPVLSSPQEVTLVRLLGEMQDKSGVFSGGAFQLAHLASCYAATMTVCLLGEAAYPIVNKQNTYQWLLSLKTPEGSFQMHRGGESDMRAIYTAISTASILGVLTPALTKKVASYIVSCQSYEGGLGSDRYSEAHGGYTYCGVAALALLGRLDDLDLDRLLGWLAKRQVQDEGGFSGRSNKLVDSCYSFWQGSVFAILRNHSHLFSLEGKQLFHQAQLQKYILLCCQDDQGGLKDKPGKMADLYHTCYSLAGMSLSQEEGQGLPQNTLPPLDPLFNIPPQKVKAAQAFFLKTPVHM